MPLNTSPYATNLKKKIFFARSGAELASRLEAWSKVPGRQAEAAGIAAHEEAERRAARRRQAAQTAAQAQQAHRQAVHLKWQRSAPMALRDSAALPLATWAQLGLLVARSSAGGVLKMSLLELQGRLSTTRPTVTGATKRLERLGWIAVERRAIARNRNAVNVYRLVHPLLIEAARSGRGGEGKGAFTAPKKDQKETGTNVQGAPLCGAGLQDEERVAPGRLESGQGGQPPQDVPEADAIALAERAAADLEIEGGDLAALAREALALYAPGLAPRAWAAGIELHGQRRAALVALEVARLVCLRDGTVDPIRNPNAYLAGTLRKPRGQCRPERTLAGLDRRPAAGQIEARFQHQ